MIEQPPRPAREHLVLAPTITVKCGLCNTVVYDKTRSRIPPSEELMAALTQHWLAVHQHACPYCWHYVPEDESPAHHRRACAWDFEEAWSRR